MRVLLVLGCVALGILLVAASHQDQAEIEAKDETIQSIDESTPKRKRKFPGCCSFSGLRPETEAAPPVLRQSRDTEEHEKLRKKHKHPKDKSKSKRRRNKNHKEKHIHVETEDAEIGHNNDRGRKHHREKKVERLQRPGTLTALGIGPSEPEKTRVDNRNPQTEDAEIGHNNDRGRKHHREKKVERLQRPGTLTALGIGPSEPEKTRVDNLYTQTEDAEIGHNNDRGRKHHREKKVERLQRPGTLTALGIGLSEPEQTRVDNRNQQDIAA
ncbi:uncharacterized protein LOC142652245 isoform X2 [Rhinoderma darwinii]|uniref:uncharacterized protein LOC142652245 isoform X2 n=1 Tax=Rhinoderma darwinii TaxID=43563 RepID=UPI003F67371E